MITIWTHNANQGPPSSIFVMWMIGWSGSVARRAVGVIYYVTRGEWILGVGGGGELRYAGLEI